MMSCRRISTFPRNSNLGAQFYLASEARQTYCISTELLDYTVAEQRGERVVLGYYTPVWYRMSILCITAFTKFLIQYFVSTLGRWYTVS